MSKRKPAEGGKTTPKKDRTKEGPTPKQADQVAARSQGLPEMPPLLVRMVTNPQTGGGGKVVKGKRVTQRSVATSHE